MGDESTTADRVVSIIADAKKIQPEEITLDQRFDELGIDSLDALEILFLFEEEFDISISDEAAADITTVRQAVEGVETALKARGND